MFFLILKIAFVLIAKLEFQSRAVQLFVKLEPLPMKSFHGSLHSDLGEICFRLAFKDTCFL